jgi:hypothetical protein
MNEVVTVRPANLTIAPLFQSSVEEAPTNVFKMSVKAQSADERRMSFVFRSPGNNLLLSPSAYVQFQIRVTVPHNYCAALNQLAISARQNGGVPGADLFTGVGDGIEGGAGSAIAFGEGNALMNCCESIQYTVNGGSVSHSNWHLFKRTLDSCFIPPKIAQRCFSQCGGSFNRFNATALSAEQSAAIGIADGTFAAASASTDIPSRPVVCGITMDSGLQCRLRNFSDNVVAVENPTHNTTGVASGDKSRGVDLIVRIQAPLDGGVFNQVYGEAGLARSSPYQKLALAIPNYNSGSVSILYKNMLKSVVRRLGRLFAPNQATIAAGGAAADYGFKVAYDASYDARLQLMWLRMQAFRRYPEAVSLATYRTQTYIQDMPDITNATATRAEYSDVPGLRYLLPSGPDGVAYNCGASTMQLAADPARVWKCQFQNLQFSQPPSYILVCAQKQSDCFIHKESVLSTGDMSADNPGAPVRTAADAIPDVNNRNWVLSKTRAVVQNQDSNLAIIRFKMLVQSSVGTFELTNDTYPFKQDQRELWDIHKRNCCQQYMEDSGISDWQSRCCCLLLSSSEYMHGLGTSSGTAFPIQITCDVDFQNKCCFMDGIQYTHPAAPGAILHRDFISARAVLVGLFDKQVLQIASASSVLSAQNFTQQTTASLLAGRT